MRAWLPGFVAVTALACGGAVEASSEDAGSAGDASTVVDASKDALDATTACTARNARCPDTNWDCRLYDCRRAVLSPKLIAFFDACLASASCTESCHEAFDEFFAADPAAAALRAQCLAKTKVCPSAIYWWLCDDLGAIAEGRRAEMSACLSSPCDGLTSCLPSLFPCAKR